MAGKVTLEIRTGEREGERFVYEEAERIFIGRQDDCGIVVPENTVSRYHCLLDINPPAAKLQDFGSLNGTYINGERIGGREKDQSAEEARENLHEEYPLKDGDRIRLGKSCEILCTMEGEPLPEPLLTLLEEEPAVGEDEEPEEEEKEEPAQESGKPEEEEGEEEEEDDEEEEEDDEEEEEEDEDEEEDEEDSSVSLSASAPVPQSPKMQPARRKCAGCGKEFVPASPENTLCEACAADRAKVLGGILAALLGDMLESEGKSAGPSPVEGYDKVSLLGRGGMGEVWKVRERKTGKVFALKTMLPQVAADENAKRMFLREAKLSECLVHKNVVRTYDSGCTNGVFYILMDLCGGGSVDALMKKKGGKLPLDLATWIILQVLSGLDYVHNAQVETVIRKKGIFAKEQTVQAKGIVHRDFKPGNIFLSDGGAHPTALVADFGMAKAFEMAGLTDMSAPRAVKGTVPFMPRQQALDCRYAKPEVDVWAAAASYYNMLTGQFPKNIRPGANMWQAIVTEAAVPIRKRDPRIPEGIAKVIDAALVEKPKIGCQSAAELRAGLIRALPADVRQYCRAIL